MSARRNDRYSMRTLVIVAAIGVLIELVGLVFFSAPQARFICVYGIVLSVILVAREGVRRSRRQAPQGHHESSSSRHRESRSG